MDKAPERKAVKGFISMGKMYYSCRRGEMSKSSSKKWLFKKLVEKLKNLMIFFFRLPRFFFYVEIFGTQLIFVNIM